MASLHKIRQHGRYVYRVSFYDKDGERRFIRLGEIGKKMADSIALHVQQLADFSYAGMSPDAEQTAWLGKIGEDLAAKLIDAGLAPKREAPATKAPLGLAEFIDDYIGKANVKGRTRDNFKQARNFLVRYFGENRTLISITAGDAVEWRTWMHSPDGGGLADNTARRHCGRAKQFFRHALQKKFATENPFGEMKDTSVRANRDRDYTLSRADAEKVLEACPDNEWRLIFALARFGGLRIPSELLKLRWADIDFHRGRMTIRSPKLEHHKNQGIRVVPLFPELRPYLEAAWDAAEDGAEFLINRYRSAEKNLRTHLERIIVRAGVKPWPKLFQNLRRTRAEELAGEYPSHVAAEWLGHSRLVAEEHYWRVNDADFEKAIKPAVKTSYEGGTEGGAQVAQTVAPHTHAPESIGCETTCETPSESAQRCVLVRASEQSTSTPDRIRRIEETPRENTKSAKAVCASGCAGLETAVAWYPGVGDGSGEGGGWVNVADLRAVPAEGRLAGRPNDRRSQLASGAVGGNRVRATL